MIRSLARLALAAAITAVAANFLAVLAVMETALAAQAKTMPEFANLTASNLGFALMIGGIALAITFVPATIVATLVGGLLWHAGRDRREARNPAVWAAAGGLCGGAAPFLLLWGVGGRPGEVVGIGLCGVATGALAAIAFRALMHVLPPRPDFGEDGGWERGG